MYGKIPASTLINVGKAVSTVLDIRSYGCALSNKLKVFAQMQNTPKPSNVSASLYLKSVENRYSTEPATVRLQPKSPITSHLLKSLALSQTFKFSQLSLFLVKARLSICFIYSGSNLACISSSDMSLEKLEMLPSDFIEVVFSDSSFMAPDIESLVFCVFFLSKLMFFYS